MAATAFEFPSRTRVTTERNPAIPKGTLDPGEGLMAKPWQDWLLTQTEAIQNSPQRIQTVALAAQGASILSTTIPLPSVPEGLYLVSVYARITQPATTSSSLIITIETTDGGVAIDNSTVALTSNTTSSTVGQVFVVRSDGGGPIQYSTTYASVGGTAMLYSLFITVQTLANL